MTLFRLLLLLLLPWRRCSCLLLLAALVVIVVVVALQQFLAEFLLSLVNVLVELVTILADRELLVVINGDSNLLFAVGLVIG